MKKFLVGGSVFFASGVLCRGL